MLHLLSMLLFMYMSNWRKIFWKTSQLWWWRWIIHIISYKNKVKVQWSFLTESTNYPSNSEQDFHAIISNDDLMNDATFAFKNVSTHFYTRNTTNIMISKMSYLACLYQGIHVHGKFPFESNALHFLNHFSSNLELLKCEIPLTPNSGNFSNFT